MSQPAQAILELTQNSSSEPSSATPQAHGFRTLLKRSLRAVVPSAAVVLSMATLTIVILVLVVTTVAQAMPPSPDTAPWPRWDPSPEAAFGDRPLSHAGLALFGTMASAEDRIDATQVALWMPAQ